VLAASSAMSAASRRKHVTLSTFNIWFCFCVSYCWLDAHKFNLIALSQQAGLINSNGPAVESYKQVPSAIRRLTKGPSVSDTKQARQEGVPLASWFPSLRAKAL
jgi:hypothetical protein